MKKRIFSLVAILLSLVMLSASAAELREDHPEFYVVQPGDTLWDISQTFLKTPWLWPEIWHVNDQVDNPHLIFPGDVLSLVYVGGETKITKNKYPEGTIKLSPKIRQLTADQAITTIPLDAILPFLTSARVLNQSEFETAPYIVGSDSNRLLAAQEHKVYVRAIKDQSIDKFSFFRRGKDYIDPQTGEYLGTEAIHLGEGQKILSGDPSVLRG
ncbi:MAG: LysM peptidoglycan-binding domain-containing protein [Enterobacterales bacterium]|nr:LysM peptidoglycan-binding domain-containing protein [Enterobacterales bacterium]